jgi:hypothetical protein
MGKWLGGRPFALCNDFSCGHGFTQFCLIERELYEEIAILTLRHDITQIAKPYFKDTVLVGSWACP